MSEAAWNKAFTQGSSALKKRLMDVHAKNPKFQSWLKSSGHGAGQSVKQASKEVKSSERVKQLQAKSLKAYGATKGTRMGSADGSGEELKDTIKPLTRDQHSKVQAAARAAKKTPLTKDQRMAAIAASVRKYKEKHDVPTVDPDDEGHDDLRDIHQSLHIRKGYNEEVEQVDEAGYQVVGTTKDKETFRSKLHPKKAEALSTHYKMAKSRKYKDIKLVKVQEEVEQVDEARRMSAAEKLGRAFDRARAESEASRRRGKELLQSRVTKEMPKKETVAEAATIASDKEVKMAKGIAFDKRYKGGNMTGASNAIEKIRPGLSKHPKVAAALRSANEEREMSYGKKIAKIMLAKQSKHPIAQNMGEAVKDQADVGEYDYEGDMAKSQLRSILTNAKRLHDMLEDTTNLPEWVQSKITLAEDYILTAANYMEGEMNEEALAALAASLDEEIELFEKAPPGSKYERMVKHIKKGYAKGGLTDKERSIAYATAWKAHNKANEEVEQIDELKDSTLKSYVKKASKEAKMAYDYHQMRYGGRDGSNPEYMKKTYPAMVAKFDRREAGVEKAKQKLAKKPVTAEGEDVAEAAKWRSNPDAYDVDDEGNKTPRNPNSPKFGYDPLQRRADTANDAKTPRGKTAALKTSLKMAKGNKGVAEGSVPTTPKEKELAKHHGDPNKITFGDVIKARLKSAAAKKMGK